MRQYKVGDKVTIRSWESMEREFGLDSDYDIRMSPNCFSKDMRRFCGSKVIIKSRFINGNYFIEGDLKYLFAPQMFADWEKKMQYNGQEVELITEGYWPEGVTLICSDDGKNWIEKKVFFLRDVHAIFDGNEHGTCWALCAFWALLPAKQAPRRLTNREVAGLCRKGWELLDGEWVYAHASYKKQYENDPTPQGVTLRAPNSDEWLEPTSDLLEVCG